MSFPHRLLKICFAMLILVMVYFKMLFYSSGLVTLCLAESLAVYRLNKHKDVPFFNLFCS